MAKVRKPRGLSVAVGLSILALRIPRQKRRVNSCYKRIYESMPIYVLRQDRVALEQPSCDSCTPRTFTSTAHCAGLMNTKVPRSRQPLAATRNAFAALIQLALVERVDFVILAGDLYDGDWPDYSTGLFFVNHVRELVRAGIPVVLLSGNHDAASRITARLTLPANVHALPTAEPGTIRFDHLPSPSTDKGSPSRPRRAT